MLKVLLPYWPGAKRLVLAGQADRGDIGDTGEFVFEVKGGKQTIQVGDATLAGWLAETKVEAVHSKVRFGVLVTQRKGVGAPNADRWYAWMPMNDFVQLATGSKHVDGTALAVPVRVELRHFLQMISDNGWVDG